MLDDEEKAGIASRASDSPRLDFPRACRLVRRSDYDAVYRAGRRKSSREFTIFLRPNGLGVSRFGWSIKKALGTAVRRNRIRRRLREIVRLHRQEIIPGWDIVVHPRSSAATASFSALAGELLRLIPRRGAPGPPVEGS
ncbi:MAG: ribonuclease P protein component [Candidatus Acidiferrales bacterium]